MLWQGTGEPEVGEKLGTGLSRGAVWLCQQDGALEKANMVQGCIRQGVFSADLTLVQGAAGISPEGAVPYSGTPARRDWIGGGREGLLPVCLDKQCLCNLKGGEKLEHC